MNKSLAEKEIKKALERIAVFDKYSEVFGEDSLPVYVTDIEEAAMKLRHRLDVGKPYDELYGKDPEGVAF